MIKNAFIIICSMILLSGCAKGVDITECVSVSPYGLFSGVWHGFIVPFSIIGSIFSKSIVIYANNNTGFGYDIGFLFGIYVAFKTFID